MVAHELRRDIFAQICWEKDLEVNILIIIEVVEFLDYSIPLASCLFVGPEP